MEQITSLARYRAALEGRVLDRVPVIPVLHVAAAELIGATIGEYATSPRTMADTVIAAYRHYGLDGVQLSLGVATEASALGSEVVQPEDGLPKVIAPAMASPEDLPRLRCPDPWRGGLMSRFLEAVEITVQEIGDEACVMAVIRGPLNIASQIRGIQELMFDLVDRPGFADELLAFCNEVALAFGRAVIAAGAHVVVIGEALASPSFISPAYYRRFVRDPHRQLCTALEGMGNAATLLHICGDIRPILGDMASTGVRIIDLDWQVSVRAARERVGDGVILRGNVDPVSVLHDGAAEDVWLKSRQAIEDAARAGRFILGSGCDVAPGTPRENIAAMVAAARGEGWSRALH